MTDIITALSGKEFRLERKNGATYDFLCIAQTKGLERQYRYDTYPGLDQDNPEATPADKHIKTGKSYTIPFSGIVDAARFAVLESDAESDVAVDYQLVVSKPLAEGGKTYQCQVWFDNLTMTAQELGAVRFTASLRVEGELTVVPAAA